MNNRFETFTLLITSISRSIRRIKTETMAQYELKSPHVSCLYYLYKKPGMTAAELCEVCEEDKAAVSRSILFLEQKGYLAREISADKGGRSGAKHYRAPLSLTEEGRTVIRVYTKSDLGAPAQVPGDGIPTVTLSSVTGEGFEALTRAVESAFIDRDLRMGEEAVVFSARQAAALRETAACIDTALENLDAGLPYDICAGDVRAAMGELGMLCGREMRQEVLDEIFSRFCVGK